MAQQQHDVGDDLDGEGGELVGEDRGETPAMFLFVCFEAARRRGDLGEVRVAVFYGRKRQTGAQEMRVHAKVVHWRCTLHDRMTRARNHPPVGIGARSNELSDSLGTATLGRQIKQRTPSGMLIIKEMSCFDVRACGYQHTDYVTGRPPSIPDGALQRSHTIVAAFYVHIGTSSQ